MDEKENASAVEAGAFFAVGEGKGKEDERGRSVRTPPAASGMGVIAGEERQEGSWCSPLKPRCHYHKTVPEMNDAARTGYGALEVKAQRHCRGSAFASGMDEITFQGA